MINKLIELGCEVEKTGEARVQEISPELIKTASNEIQQFWAALKPNQKVSYVHVIGMTAGEYYGPNRNGDWFSEENLKKYHDTFRTNANVFLHHVNKDPEKRVGKVIFSWYNDIMHRVELICEVDKARALAAKTLQSIKNGEQLFVSMGCRVEQDICSICGNKAKTRAQYCNCLKFNMKGILDDGRQAYAINPAPLKFFDISFVNRPADPTAFALDKIASEGEETIMLSADLGAQAEDYAEKIAAVSKLSTLLKRIEGDAADIEDTDVPSSMLRNLRDSDQLRHLDLPSLGFDDIMEAQHHPRHIIRGMVSMGVAPSLGEMAVCAGKDMLGNAFTPNMAGSIFSMLLMALRIIREHPEILDALANIWLRPLPEVAPEVQNLVAPVVRQRVILIKTAYTSDDFEPLVKEAGLYPGLDYPQTPPPVTGLVRRFLAQLPGDNEHGALDQYIVIGADGRPYVTNAMSVRAAANASDPASLVQNLLAGALAVGGMATALHSPNVLAKLLGAAAFVGGAHAILTDKDPHVYTPEQYKVPRGAAFIRKTAALSPGLHRELPILAMAIPAFLGADYLVNKHVRYRNDPFYEERMSTGGRMVNSLGRAVAKHPLTALGVTGVLGRAAAQHFRK